MQLVYLDWEGINDLKVNFKTYRPHFKESSNEWFVKRFKANNWLHESKICCNDLIMNTDTDYNVSDRKNVEIVYETLRDLKPANALDERLWAGILFVQLWDYVKYRRKNELESDNERDILNSFLFMRGTKRSCFINCLSRLWWTGFLLYDPTNTNHYHAIDIICESAYASNIILLSSNNFMSNNELAMGVLDSIAERKEKGEKIGRYHYVEANKYLNCMGGVTILDTMSRLEVKIAIGNRLNKLYGVI